MTTFETKITNIWPNWGGDVGGLDEVDLAISFDLFQPFTLEPNLQSSFQLLSRCMRFKTWPTLKLKLPAEWTITRLRRRRQRSPGLRRWRWLWATRKRRPRSPTPTRPWTPPTTRMSTKDAAYRTISGQPHYKHYSFCVIHFENKVHMLHSYYICVCF